MKKVFIFISIILLFIQCDHQYEYSKTIDLKNIWNKKDTLSYDFSIKNPDKKRNINFILRNNNNYPYSNIYLFVKLKQGKKTILNDTLKYILADNTGKWLGTGMGSTKEIYLGYKQNFTFPKEGKYTLSVVQGIRKDTLKGIEDFGVNIE